jgi:hypothetical protein
MSRIPSASASASTPVGDLDGWNDSQNDVWDNSPIPEKIQKSFEEDRIRWLYFNGSKEWPIIIDYEEEDEWMIDDKY